MYMMQEQRAHQKLEKEMSRSKKIKILQLRSYPKKQVQYEKRFGFRAKSSFSRAVSRAHQSVPGTSTKRRSVAKALAEKSGLMVVSNASDDEETTDSASNCTEEQEAESAEIEKMESSYFREDHVWTSPGLKDEMTLWDSDGVKSKPRKYYRRPGAVHYAVQLLKVKKDKREMEVNCYLFTSFDTLTAATT
jgi:vacuolar-type H+-ATPase subunit I/STV1